MTDPVAAEGRRRFIEDNTRLLAPPLVPEIRLHLAEESLPLWEKTEEQLGELNVPPPYWAFAWAGGQALARYTLDHPDIARNAHVVDLGAGSGLCAIAARLAGAAHVTAADIDPFSEHAMALNAAANAVELHTTTTDLLAASPPQCELLLIGDLFYEKDLSEQVMAWARAVANRGGAVLVGDPNRSFFPMDSFEKVTEYSVPVTRALEDSEIKRTSVWRLPA